ncbi:MAG: Hsp20/alpha crystallin family protein [Flavobacteriales bacterium]|nr:Hsp20/alpha crystallin family protein [Flavobacteriales bacterium]
MYTTTKKSKNGSSPVSYSAVSELFDIDQWSPKIREGYNAGSESIYGKIPAANIIETHFDFIIEMAVPGMAKSDLCIEINDHLITVSSTCTRFGLSEEERYTKREFNYNNCGRSFILPGSVVETEVYATCYDGLLTVTLPKKDDEIGDTKREIQIS